jgi:hypothetical protein
VIYFLNIIKMLNNNSATSYNSGLPATALRAFA